MLVGPTPLICTYVYESEGAVPHIYDLELAGWFGRAP
jgi:hypothetical protein